MRTASTTVPSPNTEPEQGGHARRTLVRWVFPSPQETVFSEPVIVVGREDGCHTVLEGDEVSRRHAEIRVDGPVVAVRDLGSRNGVYVNGVRVEDAPLVDGDLLRCGDWVGIVTTGRQRISQRGTFEGVFGEIAPGLFGGATLADALEPAKKLSGDLPVVVEGETGTGKEGSARAIHTWSRRGGAFLALNCAALPPDLAEGELFGYRKGAFTGAEQASPGLFRSAHGGSLFLDEILELPLGVQAKLLRAIENKQVRPLGETRDVPVDVRLIAAAQEPLRDAVADGRFRADLHARLEGLTIALPPLRERREDVVPLFLKFMKDKAPESSPRIEARLIEALCLYDWPLNVRELVLLSSRLIGLHGGEGLLKRSHLPAHMRGGRSEKGAGSSKGARGVEKQVHRSTDDDAEFAALTEALRSERTVAKAAEAIGVSRARAYRLISARKES